MARLLKCQSCNEKRTKEELEVDEIVYAKVIKRLYFCKGNCWESYLKHKEFKEKEKKKMDRLVEIIKEVHQIDLIPQQFYPDIQHLRNGNYTRKKNSMKYKQGFTYRLIAETYRFCQNDIRRSKQMKTFTGTLNELRYGLAIVKDKIMLVKTNTHKADHKNALQEAKQNNQREEAFEERELNFKKKHNPNDISQFLDE